MKDVLDLSTRSVTTREAAMAESIHPLNIFQFVSPYLFHRRTYGPTSWDAVYIGSATLLLSVWLLTRVRHLETYRRLTIALFITAIATFCFSLGDYGHMYGWKLYIPVVNGFHSPGRLIILSHFALSLCAALAILDLHNRCKRDITSPWRKLWPLAVLPLASWCIVIGVWAIRFFPDSAMENFVGIELLTTQHRILGALLISVAATGVALAARGYPWAIALLLIFTLADISLYGLRHKDRMNLVDLIESVEVPPETDAYRVSGYYQPNYGLDTPILRGVNVQGGYITFKPRRQLDYDQVPAMRVAAMGWIKIRYDFDPKSVRKPDRGERWEKVANPMPRLRFVGESQVSDDMAADIMNIDVERTALTATQLRLEGGTPGEVHQKTDAPGDVRFLTKTDVRQLLVFSESYHAGWKVLIDEEESEVIPVYGDIMGCVVEPGEHEIRFYFDPDSLSIGKKLAYLGLSLLCFYTVAYRFTIQQWSRGNYHDLSVFK